MSDAPDGPPRALLTLHLTEGLGPVRSAALLERFGSAERVLRATSAELRSVPGIGEQLADALPRRFAAIDLDAELERVRRAGARVLVHGQPGYPEWLSEVPAAPRLLFVRGTIEPGDARAVALVGTRRPTPAGRRVAQQLAEGLARAGVVVVSGLARGVDGFAHRAALDAGGRTLAVLAGGLARVYPPEHRDLAELVVGSGALLSEGRMEQEPERGLFPARNRIISGLSRVVVIVQAPAKSGALITAEHAAEQGRTVLAVPGPVDEAESAGCNRLIRDGAVLCRGVQDVLEELDGVSAVAAAEKVKVAAAGPPPGLDDVQRRVWELLGQGQRAADVLAQQLGVSAPQLAGVLMKLEVKKVVRRLPGNRYERC